MIYFRKKVISYPPEVAPGIIHSLKKITANKYSFLDAVSTGAWVIFPERQFVGINLKDGGIKIARYRSPLLRIIPKVIAKISAETKGDSSALHLSFRFGLLSFLLIVFLSISPVRMFIQLLTGNAGFELFSLIPNLLGIFIVWGLAVIESKTLEKKILETAKIELIGKE